MLVKDVMIPSGRLVTISPMAKVRDALVIMREKHVKSIVVEKHMKMMPTASLPLRIFFIQW